MMLSRAFLLWIIFYSRVASALSSPKTTSINPALLSQVRAAMTTTTESQSNVAKAYDACGLWDDIPMGELPDSVRAVSSVLHAACLARVGRDSEAEEVYRSCLLANQANYLEPKALQDAKIGRASALQRLMRYDEATEQFLDAGGTLGAVTCCMRRGEMEQATRILEEQIEQGNSKEVRAMLIVMKTLQGVPVDDAALGALKAAASESPLFQWLTSVAVSAPTSASSDQQQYLYGYDILQIAAINQCPFDDPLLLNLDDKIKLHRLLDSKEFSFWPKGFILPDELDSFRHNVNVQEGNTRTNKDWILKSRAGYGSHGNQIASAACIESLCADRATASPPMKSRLCQRLVDPPLLLDGRKFSMRVYVYCFGSNSSIYLCNKGLVKLASEVYCDDENDDNRMHMTNSGREDVMLQYDFEYLRENFQEAGWSYDDFWNKVRDAVTATMRCYQCDCNEAQQQAESSSYRKELAKLGIPKILGFDFMATDRLEPMLLEVNRFPGLEARGDGDEEVKRTVVREAWICAAGRIGLAAADGINAPEVTTGISVASSKKDEEVSYESLTI